MKFIIEIDCDNAAFADECDAEVARILRSFADKLTARTVDLHDWPTLRDVNGNRVGAAGYSLSAWER